MSRCMIAMALCRLVMSHDTSVLSDLLDNKHEPVLTVYLSQRGPEQSAVPV